MPCLNNKKLNPLGLSQTLLEGILEMSEATIALKFYNNIWRLYQSPALILIPGHYKVQAQRKWIKVLSWSIKVTENVSTKVSFTADKKGMQ